MKILFFMFWVTLFLSSCAHQDKLALELAKTNAQIRSLQAQIGKLESAIPSKQTIRAEVEKVVKPQRADLNSLHTRMAVFNKQIKLVREGDLTQLYEQLEVVHKMINEMQPESVRDIRKEVGVFHDELSNEIRLLQSTLASHQSQIQAMEYWQTIEYPRLSALEQMDHGRQAL